MLTDAPKRGLTESDWESVDLWVWRPIRHSILKRHASLRCRADWERDRDVRLGSGNLKTRRVEVVTLETPFDKRPKSRLKQKLGHRSLIVSRQTGGQAPLPPITAPV